MAKKKKISKKSITKPKTTEAAIPISENNPNEKSQLSFADIFIALFDSFKEEATDEQRNKRNSHNKNQQSPASL